MDPQLLVTRILDDEGLTAGLDGPAAEALVAWLVKNAEAIAAEALNEAEARKQVEALCRRGRRFAEFVARKPAEEQVVALNSLTATEGP